VPAEVEPIKECLAEGFPIVFGLKLTQRFFKPLEGGYIPTPDPDDPRSEEHGLHAMYCVCVFLCVHVCVCVCVCMCIWAFACINVSPCPNQRFRVCAARTACNGMFVYMYVCMYVYFKCVYMYIYLCIYLYVNIHMYMPWHVSEYVRI